MPYSRAVGAKASETACTLAPAPVSNTTRMKNTLVAGSPNC